MPRAQTLKKKGRSSSSAEQEGPADAKSEDGASGRSSRGGSDRPTEEGAGRPTQESRPVSTRAALGFKDED